MCKQVAEALQRRLACHAMGMTRKICGLHQQLTGRTCLPLALQFGPDGLPSFGGSDEGLPPELRDCNIM